MRLMLMVLVAMLAGCASPGEIRESGYNRTVAVTDIKQVGDQVEARIAIGPAVFTQNSFAAAIEKAVRACGR